MPVLLDGEGPLIGVNPLSGDPGYDPTDDIREAFPAATAEVVRDGVDLADQLEEQLAVLGDGVRALGAVVGEGTVAAVVALASRYQLPTVVVPAGTLNHFARDVGVYDPREAVDATGVGEAVAVELGVARIHQADGPPSVRHFLNTASLGGYPDLVRLRERWRHRWGRWPTFAAALITVPRRAAPVELGLDGVRHSVWILFIGNGPYHPRGMVPAFRPRLDTGLLDVRWLRADPRFSRPRAFFALILAGLGHSRVYGQRTVSSLEVTLTHPARLATDGEVARRSTRFSFGVAPKPVPVYRRDEHNPRWTDRYRPHQPR